MFLILKFSLKFKTNFPNAKNTFILRKPFLVDKIHYSKTQTKTNRSSDYLLIFTMNETEEANNFRFRDKLLLFIWSSSQTVDELILFPFSSQHYLDYVSINISSKHFYYIYSKEYEY